jgi:hypothetical protein
MPIERIRGFSLRVLKAAGESPIIPVFRALQIARGRPRRMRRHVLNVSGARGS